MVSSMELILWKDFSKRKNSTKIPTTEGTTFDIVLKEDTDMENPVIVLEPVDLGYTYAKFNNNYYFVDSEIVLTKNLMQLSLSMDSLASNKTAIGNTNAFIEFSSTGYDVNKIDNRLGVSITKTYESSTEVAMPLLSQNGLYILSVANAGSVTRFSDNIKDTGFTTQYILRDSSYGDNIPSTLLAVKQLLMMHDWATDLIKVFNDPYQSVISCIWLPLHFISVSSNPDYALPFTRLQFGDKYVEGDPDSFPSLKKAVIPIDDTVIPISWRYDDFRRNSPYTTLSLFIPLYGNIDLAVSDFVESENVHISGAYDLTTGDVILSIKNDAGAISQTINFNMAANCPIASIRGGADGVLSGVMSTVGNAASIASGNYVSGAASAVMSAQSAALSSLRRNVSIKGSITGRTPVALGTNFILTTISVDTEDPDNASYIALQGRPVMHYGIISAHPGYVQCANASFAGSVLSSERDEINSYLNSGFYYE